METHQYLSAGDPAADLARAAESQPVAGGPSRTKFWLRPTPTFAHALHGVTFPSYPAGTLVQVYARVPGMRNGSLKLYLVRVPVVHMPDNDPGYDYGYAAFNAFDIDGMRDYGEDGDIKAVVFSYPSTILSTYGGTRDR